MWPRHQLGLAVTDLPFSILTDTSTLPESHSFRKPFLRELATLRTCTDQTLENAPLRYKCYFAKSVCVTPAFLPGQYVFVDRQPEQLIPAALLAHQPRLNLLSKTIEPSEIVSTMPDTVTIDEDRIQNTVHINCVPRTPEKTEAGDETDKISVPIKCVSLPLDYHPVTESTNPNIMC